MNPEQLGKYTLYQTPDVFPLGADTVDLSGFATLRPGWQVWDLGCGSGALGLLLLEREPTLHLTGVEMDPLAVEVANQNYSANQISGEIHSGDLRTMVLPAGVADLVVSNPPFFVQGSGGDGGTARMEGLTLQQLCHCAGRLLKNRGRFALCHRPERLAELFSALKTAGLEPKRLQLVQHNTDTSPSLVLVEAVRQGRPGLELLPTRLRNF